MRTRKLIRFQLLQGRAILLVSLCADIIFLTGMQLVVQIVAHETVNLSASLVYWNVLFLCFVGLFGGESWTLVGLQNGVSRRNTLRAVLGSSAGFAAVGLLAEAIWWGVQQLFGNQSMGLLSYFGYTGQWPLVVMVLNVVALWLLYSMAVLLGYCLSLLKLRMDGNQRGLMVYIWLITAVGIVLINWVPRVLMGSGNAMNWLQLLVNVPAIGPLLLVGLLLGLGAVFASALWLLLRKLDLHAAAGVK